MIGEMLDHYEVESRLGEGGSGVVYRGRDLRLGRPVAIKVLAEALRDDELAWGRLLREARLASQLNHPHIAAIYDLGEEEGRAFIVMEYVEGMSLADLIPEGGLPLEQVMRYAGQIAEALEFAHQQGVLHGDLKGSNIVITPDGDIKLLDFGLGRRIPRRGMEEVSNTCLPLAEEGATAGTLPYLAPELLRGDPISLQSDIWALGVLLYQMATGELPFHGATPFELSMEIMVCMPPRMGQVPEPLLSVLRRCLEKDSRLRLPRVRELATCLENPTHRSGAVLPVGETAGADLAAPPEAHRAVHRTLTWWAAGVSTAVLALLLGAVYTQHFWVLRHTPRAVPESPAPSVPTAGNPDVKVWVNTDSQTYHCPGARWYGKTQAGEYMSQKLAREKGYRPAANRACM